MGWDIRKEGRMHINTIGKYNVEDLFIDWHGYKNITTFLMGLSGGLSVVSRTPDYNFVLENQQWAPMFLRQPQPTVLRSLQLPFDRMTS